MAEKTQNLSLRLLRPNVLPEDAVRTGVELEDWPTFPSAKIVAGPLGGGPPAWTDFLELSQQRKASLHQRFAYGLVFLQVQERWFALAFGLGHAKILPTAIEQDFGLRVVLNAVDHTKLRSADLRTPDTNTLSRRSQTSRGSERTAFEIDPERDIVRGLLGEPKDKTFATRISGSDALTVRRKAKVADLPDICARALALSAEDTYKAEFGWIDQIKHIRDEDQIRKLDEVLVEALDAALALNPEEVEEISLAYPTIYEPDKAGWVRFRGFGLTEVYPDLEIAHYVGGLKAKGIDSYEPEFLKRHAVEETDEAGKLPGQSWPVYDCIVYEAELDSERYTLSGGRWYRIDKALADEVVEFFAKTEKVELPPAEAGDNEKLYNERLAAAGGDLLSMDVKLVKPSDASSPIEVCDFLASDKRLIHIKDKSESSRLSHLFNQGLVSAVVLKRDAPFRDRVREKVAQQPHGGEFIDLIPDAASEMVPSEYKVVFGVLVHDPGENEPKLPFFSLISFRHAARRISAELGYHVAFAWIRKPGVGAGKKPKRTRKAKEAPEGPAPGAAA